MNRSVIPNVIPHREHAEDAGEVKPVWRLAFFSRLEQRKGLKLFVDAVSRLDPKKLNKKCAFHFCHGVLFLVGLICNLLHDADLVSGLETCQYYYFHDNDS